MKLKSVRNEQYTAFLAYITKEAEKLGFRVSTGSVVGDGATQGELTHYLVFPDTSCVMIANRIYYAHLSMMNDVTVYEWLIQSKKGIEEILKNALIKDRDAILAGYPG